MICRCAACNADHGSRSTSPLPGFPLLLPASARPNGDRLRTPKACRSDTPANYEKSGEQPAEADNAPPRQNPGACSRGRLTGDPTVEPTRRAGAWHLQSAHGHDCRAGVEIGPIRTQAAGREAEREHHLKSNLAGPGIAPALALCAIPQAPHPVSARLDPPSTSATAMPHLCATGLVRAPCSGASCKRRRACSARAPPPRASW